MSYALVQQLKEELAEARALIADRDAGAKLQHAYIASLEVQLAEARALIAAKDVDVVLDTTPYAFQRLNRRREP